MKKILLSCFVVLQTALVYGQPAMPSYPQVMKHFFLNYSYETETPYDKLVFAKKKGGWYVAIIDQVNKDGIKSEQLFWSLEQGRYYELNGFSASMTEEDADAKIQKIFYNDGSPLAYGYERCRYYGYNTWDVDMITDFGNVRQTNDTLLEGLGRAYANYAERYIWYGFGGYPFDDDTLKIPLRTLQLPGKERIDRLMFYIHQAMGYYQQLQTQNPGFKLRVGTPKMKILNEQFHLYQQLLIAGYEKEARAVLDEVESNDSIYRWIGHAYLDACPLNSILITYGDNDTYPLWYVQEKEGYRKDVTVVNNSLLGFAPYVNRLKKTTPGLFTTNPESFGNTYYSYFPFDADITGSNNDTLSLSTLIKDIQTIKYPHTRVTDTIPAYVAKHIVLTTNFDRLKRLCGQSNLSTRMYIELGDYLLLNELLILDMLNANLSSRPVYVTANAGLLSGKYLQREGSVYRILPLTEDSTAKQIIETTKTEDYLNRYPDPALVYYSGPVPHFDNVLYNLHTSLYAGLIRMYVSLGNKEKTDQWVERYFNNPAMQKLMPDVEEYEMAETLLNAGYIKEVTLLVEKLAPALYQRSRVNSAVEAYPSKDGYLSVLRYLVYLFEEKKITPPGVLNNTIRTMAEE